MNNVVIIQLLKKHPQGFFKTQIHILFSCWKIVQKRILRYLVFGFFKNVVTEIISKRAQNLKSVEKKKR